MQIDADTRRRILEHWPVARLATLDPQGSPHMVPIVFASSDGAIWSPIDGKPKAAGAPELARLRNIAANPGVSLLLDHYDAEWSRLWWLRIDGRARCVGLGGTGAASGLVPSAEPDMPAPFGAVVKALAAKYPQYRETPMFAGDPRLIRIEIGRCRSWASSPEALAPFA